MKRRISGLMFLLTIILAQPTQAAFGGVRLGGMFGVQLLQGKHYYTGPNSPADDMMKRLSVMGSLFGAHVGYLAELGPSKIVVGGEFYFLSPGAKATIDLGLLKGLQEGGVSINHTQSMGVVLQAGMMFNPKVLVYALAGLEQAKFQFEYSFTLAGLPPKQVLKKTFNTFTVGVGAGYKITPHFIVGLELSNPFFRRFKIRASPPRGFNYKPAERRALLKLSYLF